MSDLVPNDRRVISHISEIDQALFQIHCISADSGTKPKQRVFSVFGLKYLSGIRDRRIRQRLRRFIAVAIERGYLVYRRYLQMRAHRAGVSFSQAFVMRPGSVNHRRFTKLTNRAKTLYQELRRTLRGFVRATKGFNFERVLDGVVGTVPPWAAQGA